MMMHKPGSTQRAARPPVPVSVPVADLPNVRSVDGGFAQAMAHALQHHPRRIAPTYFYDETGSRLFETICAQPEYYVTRVEMGILAEHGPDIARHIGPQAELVEFGAGSCRKFRHLLPSLEAPMRYVPIDISASHLRAEAEALQRDHPLLDVHPVAADFNHPFTVGPALPGTRQRVGLYLGSSLGNFERREALEFLRMAARQVAGGALLVGIDLVKPPAVLHAAYNDAAGVTAAFNLNLLARANQELGTDFDLRQFAHHACYHPPAQRVEMHLISKRAQTVHLNGVAYEFREGESLHTENSHKFTLTGFRELAAQAGLTAGPVWMDDQRWFALQWLHGEAFHPASTH
jgi:dimethylhistidine N-methyltransferase